MCDKFSIHPLVKCGYVPNHAYHWFLIFFLEVNVLWCVYMHTMHMAHVYRFLNSAERGLYIMFMCTLLGAWLGAVPIPLDWNRPWQVGMPKSCCVQLQVYIMTLQHCGICSVIGLQVWPIPCSCGALAGSLVGSGLSFLAQQYSLFLPQLFISRQKV